MTMKHTSRQKFFKLKFERCFTSAQWQRYQLRGSNNRKDAKAFNFIKSPIDTKKNWKIRSHLTKDVQKKLFMTERRQTLRNKGKIQSFIDNIATENFPPWPCNLISHLNCFSYWLLECCVFLLLKCDQIYRFLFRLRITETFSKYSLFILI